MANVSFITKQVLIFFSFYTLKVIARVIVDYKNKFEKNHALINRVTGATTETEQRELMRISSNSQIQATVLPIRSVGVQGMPANN